MCIRDRSEAVTESETAGSEQQTEEAEDSEADSEITDIDADEFDDLVEQAQNQDTYCLLYTSKAKTKTTFEVCL